MSSKKTQFKPGRSGNPAGRPPGALNKISKPIKERIGDFLNDNFDDVVDAFAKLPPRDKVKLFVDLLPFIVPKQTQLDADMSLNFETMPEPVLDAIVDKLYSKQKKNKDE